jgi:hypothetical protein
VLRAVGLQKHHGREARGAEKIAPRDHASAVRMDRASEQSCEAPRGGRAADIRQSKTLIGFRRSIRKMSKRMAIMENLERYSRRFAATSFRVSADVIQ